MPMKFRISSQYGVFEEIRNGRMHAGVDLAMPTGTELHSIASGTVERVVHHTAGLGNGVYVRAGNGDVHVYGHLNKVNVHQGDRVSAGDLLGYSGNTGHSTGPHLHFGLLHKGQIADPSALIDSVQYYSGEIAGPALLGIKGPATVMFQNPIVKHVTHSATTHVLSWLREAGMVIFDLSYGICLVGCAALIILGALGLKDGYRWAGMTFGIYSVIRLFGGGKL
jgi:murein DD-endopeptidase MepM/ murein hydrolase activator NlpD